MPQVSTPTCVIHGLCDEVVPHDLSESFVAKCTGPTKLVSLDDDHALTAPASLQQLVAEAADICELLPNQLLEPGRGWRMSARA